VAELCSAHPAGTPSNLAGLQLSTEVLAEHPDEKARRRLLGRYMSKEKKTTQAGAPPHQGAAGANAAGNQFAALLDTSVAEISVITYGPSVRLQAAMVWLVLAAQATNRSDPQPPWRAGGRLPRWFAVPTHLLGMLDDPARVLAPLCPRSAPGRDMPHIVETPLR